MLSPENGEAHVEDPEELIGALIEDPVRKADWRSFVAALHEAAAPGGPLDGWLFHGTTADVASLVQYEGVTTTEALCQTRGGNWKWTEGTHWGIPKVAAFYAEDRIESFDDPDLDLAILAVRTADLEECGRFSADGQTVDCPVYTRLGRPDAETDRMWDASAKDWKACLEAFGTLLVLGAVPPGLSHTLTSADDVAQLAETCAPGPRP